MILINNNKTFKSEFFKVFSEINFGFNIKNLGYLPRWLILFIDVIIVLVSIAITYFLFQGLRLDYISGSYLGIGIVIYLLVNIFFFWLLRTYSGIIRHSSYIDSLKLFFSQFATFLVLLLINLIFILFDKHKLFLTTGAFINSIISFSFLFFYRIIVKQSFELFFSETSVTKKIKVLIYGSDEEDIELPCL